VVIATIPTTIAAVSSLVVSLKNRSAISEVHLSINSRMDQMLALKDDLIKAAKESIVVQSLASEPKEEKPAARSRT
jgi:hypothetical protein